MKLIVGLGNPGEKYSGTRHNAGFLFVDRLLKNKLPNNVVARKSDVFMNESGKFAKKLVDYYSLAINQLYIAHDDLDMPLGSYKIQFGVGPKVHNGVNSIESELGTKDFWRIRIGVDNRKKEGEPSYAEASEGKEYVLQDFTQEERRILDGVMEKICKETNRLLQ